MSKRITQQHYDAQARIAELEAINVELVKALKAALALIDAARAALTKFGADVPGMRNI